MIMLLSVLYVLDFRDAEDEQRDKPDACPCSSPDGDISVFITGLLEQIGTDIASVMHCLIESVCLYQTEYKSGDDKYECDGKQRYCGDPFSIFHHDAP